MEDKRYHIVIVGRVQGVGFRYFVDQNAKSLHLTGWVHNRMDNSVELEIQGEVERLDIFMKRIHEGPTFAKVEAVDRTEISVNANEKEFKIRMD